MFTHRQYFSITMFIILFTILLGGCKDESEPIIPPADHFQPEGILITSSGDTIVYYFQGAVRPGDTIKAPSGNNLSPHYNLKFLDANKSQIPPPSITTHKLGWTIAHNNIAELYRDPGDEWNFHIRGKDSGITTIIFKVLHGDHPDFITNPIPIKVDPSFVGDAAGIIIQDEESGDTLVLATSQSIFGKLTTQLDSTTDHMALYFFDDEGIKFQPPVPPHSLIYQIDDDNKAEIIPAGPLEPWAFQLKGKAVGRTKVNFSLLNSGSTIYTSPDIEINIIP